MRVIAGQYRRRLLRTLPGMDVRPTADRLRETLFDVLCAGNPEALTRSVWLDLYAGTGAVGIEALSRGAAMVYFVESSKAAGDVIAENLKSLGIAGGFKILRAEVRKALTALASSGVAADFVFMDPPYRMREEYAQTLEVIAESTVMRASGVVIAEHEKRFDPPEAPGRLMRRRKLSQGDAALSFYRWDL